MILAVDVHYVDDVGVCAGVAIDSWSASSHVASYVHSHAGVAEYQPGKFYQRELPCILGLISQFGLAASTIIIDGYVFLDGREQPGLGKHLFDALDRKTAVVGVAKSAYRNIGNEFAVYRGRSKTPLFVTSVGVDHKDAKRLVGTMHGRFRLPDVIRQADQLARSTNIESQFRD